MTARLYQVRSSWNRRYARGQPWRCRNYRGEAA
ncbi:hypothetical protein FFI39_006875 [Janthinobacterium sp. KBS0711]|nr:hypothetical protein FFI39_006875 [Janthinobacterium sp. KBS0711]